MPPGTNLITGRNSKSSWNPLKIYHSSMPNPKYQKGKARLDRKIMPWRSEVVFHSILGGVVSMLDSGDHFVATKQLGVIPHFTEALEDHYILQDWLEHTARLTRTDLLLRLYTMANCGGAIRRSDGFSLPAIPEYLLNSNESLLPKTTIEVRANLETVASRIRALDSQIAVLNAYQEEHQTYLRKYEPLLSCVRSVPPEIWAKIFLRAQQQFLATEQITLSSNSPCIQVSHVCRSWRMISTGTPRLWAIIAIKTSRLPKGRGPLDMLDAWLTASRCAGLYITLDATVPMWRDDAARDVLRRSLARLLAHSHRWISFSFSICLEDFRILAFKIRDAPILHDLTLDIRHHTVPYGASPNDIDLLEPNSVPLLRTINVTHIIPTGRVLQHLPSSSVKSCSLICFASHVGWSELQAFFQSCASLEHLSFGISSIQKGSPDQRTPLYGLQSLDITTAGAWFLDAIIAPSLTRLSLIRLFKEDAQLVEPFISCHPSLRELAIRCGPYSDYPSMNVLDGFENHSSWSIQTLEFDCYPNESLASFLELFSARDPQSVLPYLMSLKISLMIGEGSEIRLRTVLRVRDAIVRVNRQMGRNCHSNSAGLHNIEVKVAISASASQDDDDRTHELYAFRSLMLEGVDVQILGDAAHCN